MYPTHKQIKWRISKSIFIFAIWSKYQLLFFNEKLTILDGEKS